MTKTLGKPERINGVWLSFLLGLAVSFAIFLPFLIVDKGFFLYVGDYNSQQVPFYYYLQQFIKDGTGTWSWATDLGTSAVNSYSFYNLGSPFMWLTLLFPQRWLPYLMVPLFMLKFGGIAAAAALYLKRHTTSRNVTVICSVIYAFCGFNIYNIFFNHMLEPVVLFPLMLWALDSFMIENKRGWFGLFVGLALLNSYFFFVGNVVFILIYFVVKVVQGDYILTPARFGGLAVETLLGVGIGMALALPSFFNLIQNPRTSNFASGYDTIIYPRSQQYFAIISSLFLPPEPPYDPNLFTSAAIKWTSMSAFLPVVSVAGVAAYWKGTKKSAAKTLLIISAVMAMVPILNASFYAFNRSYYARWYYMPLLIMVLATANALQRKGPNLVYGAKVAVIATGLFGLLGLIPTKHEDGWWQLGVAENGLRFWVNYLTAMLAVVLFFVIVWFYKDRKRFTKILLALVLGFSVFYSVIHLSLGKFQWWERDSSYKDQQYIAAQKLDLPDDEFYRIDAYKAHDNLGLWVDKSCLQTFNSVVTPSIMEFYPSVGVERDVSSKPKPHLYALRGLLSVRYTVMPTHAVAAFEEELTGSKGWQPIQKADDLVLYENDNYVPLGFYYNHYIDTEQLETVPEQERSAILMRAIGLTPPQIEKYGYLFDGALPKQNRATGYDYYVEDCNARRAASSHTVTADASGFTSRITLDRDNLVFYAVPYDEGFTATVNGAEAEILKVSNGLMAVPAQAGENDIVFSYKTPGFHAGLAITFGSLALLGVYWFVGHRRDKRGKTPHQPATSTDNNTLL